MNSPPLTQFFRPTALSTNRWPTGRPRRSAPPAIGSAMRLMLAESRTCRWISHFQLAYQNLQSAGCVSNAWAVEDRCVYKCRERTELGGRATRLPSAEAPRVFRLGSGPGCRKRVRLGWLCGADINLVALKLIGATGASFRAPLRIELPPFVFYARVKLLIGQRH
jgi:hypothetical protein